MIILNQITTIKFMRKIIYACILLALVSCETKVSQLYEDSIYDSKSSELKSIEDKQTELLGQTIGGPKKFYYQEKENSNVYEVQSAADFQKSTYAEYTIARNKENIIVYIEKSRHDSCFGGDNGKLTYRSYFDNDGNLMLFEKSEEPFGGIPDGCGYYTETSNYWFNKNHTLLKKTFDLFQDGKIATSKDCKKNIPIDYEIYMTVNEYLSKNKFKNNESNTNNSTIVDESINSSNDNSTNTDLPMSNYFKIEKIFNVKYDNRGFEMDFDLLNNSDYKFSSVNFHAAIYYKLKDGNSELHNVAQHDAWLPYSHDGSGNHVLNWEPRTIQHIYFRIEPCFTDYRRTPEKLMLLLKVENATSVDAEINGNFAVYDLLDLWKEKQVKEGLR